MISDDLMTVLFLVSCTCRKTASDCASFSDGRAIMPMCYNLIYAAKLQYFFCCANTITFVKESNIMLEHP